MKKRILAIVLCLMMVLTSGICSTVFANGTINYMVGKTGTVTTGATVYAEPDENSKSYNIYAYWGDYYFTVEEAIQDANGQVWYKYSSTTISTTVVEQYPYIKASDIKFEDSDDPGQEEDPDTTVDIEPGDADAIVDYLDTLQEDYTEEVTSYEDCEAFYAKMMDAYRAAFVDDETVVTEEEMVAIDAEFGTMQDALYNDFGWTEVQDEAKPMMMKSARTNAYGLDRAGEDATKGGVQTTKNVTDGTVSDYLLTLESWSTGEVVDYVTPVDLILVLDQSASMYAPMGLSAGKDHRELFTDNTSDLNRYALDSGKGGAEVQQNLKTLFESTDEDEAGQTFRERCGQLGYLVAQSRTGGSTYKDVDHECKKDCPSKEGNDTYDWFIVQYVEDDPQGKPWHFYRVSRTANPSTDWDYSHDYDPKVVKYANFDKIGASHFYFYKSQTGALYDAITGFAANLKKSGGNHRLAVTSFASGNKTSLRYASFGSGIYVNGQYIEYNNRSYGANDPVANTTSGGWITQAEDIYRQSTITDSEYESALMDIQSNYDGVFASINAVTTDFFQTYQNVGLDIAYNIIDNATEVEGDLPGYEREKIVVLFTDGSPSGPKTGDIVSKAAEVKATGAKIYTVCTATLPETDNSRQFLEYSSSDYPNATGVVGKDEIYSGEGAATTPYYAKTAKNAAELVAEFNSIVEDVGGADNATLDSTTVLKDIISESFTLPEELVEQLEGKTDAQAQSILKNAVSVYTAEYMGDETYASRIPFDADITFVKDENGEYKTVEVTNFDYSANYISENGRGDEEFRGKKLIVEIQIDTIAGFLGGDDIDTNDEESGIYTGGGAVAVFPKPTVDINVNQIVPEFTTKNIYLSQAAALPSVLNLGIFTEGTGEEKETFKVDGINNAYVDIVYTITAPDGKIATYTIPAGTPYTSMTDHGWTIDEGMVTHPLLKEDTEYKLTCVVTSVNDTTNHSGDEDKNIVTEKINVFKPEITFKDSAIELGDVADYSDNGGFVVWKHNGTEAPGSMGTAPVLEYSYTPGAESFTEDTPVKVDVTAKSNGTTVPVDQLITEYVKFYRNGCDFMDCENNTKTEVSATAEDRVNFVVHLKTFDLVISKEGAQLDKDENQAFLFRVTDDKGFSMDVVVEGNGSTTIKNVPAGVYKVTELTNWSWRYTPEGGVVEKTADASKAIKGEVPVTFKNERTMGFWLSGDSFCENHFNKRNQ